MKKLYIILLFSFGLSNLFGQVTLTLNNNSLMPGDSSHMREIAFVSPGKAGENQVWDFSGIRFTGKKTFCGISADLSFKMAGNAEKGLILTEDGYDYSYIFGNNSYQETGYVNTAKNLKLSYSDPVIKMQYPFSYGQQFSDPFAGVAWYNEASKIELDGMISVKADAFGTLILPDRILKNALRVKSTKQSLQTSMCGSVQSTITKYNWFAPGCRYPVMTITTTENSYSGKEPVVVKSAWVNLDQQMFGSSTAGTESLGQVETAENTVIVYPNPFTDQVTYNYFLRKLVPVTVELYDMSGKFNIRIEKRALQAEGLHTGSIDATIHSLNPGVYYLRFMFDKQVVVSKIVKI